MAAWLGVVTLELQFLLRPSSVLGMIADVRIITFGLSFAGESGAVLVGLYMFNAARVKAEQALKEYREQDRGEVA